MLENRIIRTSDGLGQWRIVLDTDDVLYCYPFGKSRSAVALSRDFFDSALEKGKIDFVADPGIELPHKELSEAQVNKRDENFDRIEAIWNDHKDDLVTKSKTECLKQCAQEYNVSAGSLSNHLDRYLEGGGVRNALIPHYENCTGKGNVNLKTPGKQGACRKVPLHFMDDIYSHYAKRKKKKPSGGKPDKTHWSEIYRDIKLELFTDKDGFVEDFFPEYDQLTYWARNKQDRMKSSVREKGYIDAYNNDRLLTGTEDQYLFNVGSLWEIDCTIPDIGVVSLYDREKVLASAKLITIVDVYSRYIVGFYLFLENDSWREEINALASAVMPKDELGRLFDCEIDPESWKASGFLPKFIRSDRGPFLSKYKDSLVNNFGVYPQYTASGAASGKGVVERRFLHINDIITSYLSGSKSPGPRQRGEKDPASKAKFTINELFEAVYYVVDYLNHKEVEGFELTQEMVVAGVSAVPAEIWDFSISKNFGMFREVDPDNLLRNLLPREHRKVTRRGIRFKNNYYSAGSEKARQYLSQHMGDRVNFVYDPKQTGLITVLTEEGGMIDLPRVTKDPLKKRASESEDQAYRDMEKKNREKNKASQVRNEQKLKERMESLQKRVSEPSGSMSGRHPKDKRKNTKEELEIKAGREEIVPQVNPVVSYGEDDEDFEHLDQLVKEQQS